jgi:hypothetical protein
MATVAELQAQLDRLRSIRRTGALRVQIGDERVEFRSDAELAAAITDLEAEINGAGAPPITLVYVSSTKGL